MNQLDEFYMWSGVILKLTYRVFPLKQSIKKDDICTQTPESLFNRYKVEISQPVFEPTLNWLKDEGFIRWDSLHHGNDEYIVHGSIVTAKALHYLGPYGPVDEKTFDEMVTADFIELGKNVVGKHIENIATANPIPAQIILSSD